MMEQSDCNLEKEMVEYILYMLQQPKQKFQMETKGKPQKQNPKRTRRT